jgi:hypothetical protein
MNNKYANNSIATAVTDNSGRQKGNIRTEKQLGLRQHAGRQKQLGRHIWGGNSTDDNTSSNASSSKNASNAKNKTWLWAEIHEKSYKLMRSHFKEP